MKTRWFVAVSAIGLVAGACSVVNAPADPEGPGAGGSTTSTTSSNNGGGGNGGGGDSSCDDGEQNGNETDVDCGGDACEPCNISQGCQEHSDCLGNACVDGVCCQLSCGELCMACSEDKTGQPDGFCAPVLAGTDPDSECIAEDPSTCGVAGGCDGEMEPACLTYPAGTACEGGTCTAGMLAPGSECDESGTCVALPATSCTPYVCNPQGTDCLNSCMTSQQCAPGFTCINGQCNCGTLSGVGQPVVVTQLGSTQGVWMEDPLETLGPGIIWRINHYSQSNIQRFNSVAALQQNAPADQWTLPTNQNGTGAVVYDGYLYYNKDNTPNIVKYNLTTKQVEIDLPLPSGTGFHNTYAYQWGGYSDIDFAVDEQGLWVLYASSSSGGNIVISKLDPNNLAITQTWNTTHSKQTGQAFMICGRMYTVASYSQSNTTIDYMFDTNTNAAQSLNIPFTNGFGYNSMVDYNPNTGMLYSWDSQRHVNYSLQF